MTTYHHSVKLKHQKRKYILTFLLVLILLISVFLISLNTGAIRLSPIEVLKTAFGLGTAQNELILFEFRLPRLIIAVLVGGCLGISGLVLQGLVRNPLADPGIIGINAGAGLGVVIFTMFIPQLTLVTVFAMPIFAFIGAITVAIMIYILAYKKGEGSSPVRIILTGIAIAAGLNAIMLVLTLKLSPEDYHFITTWLAGNIWGSNWKFIIAIIPWLIIFMPIIYFKANTLNIMQLGDSLAIGLGLKIEKERKILLFSAVAIASAGVSISGGIGFIGLIAPHMTRRLVGEKHEHIIPIVGLVGALLLLTADTLSRLLFASFELPAGIIVAILGAPYFLYLLVKLDD